MMPSRPNVVRVPGDAGVRVGPVGRRRDQHVEVGQATGTRISFTARFEVSTAARRAASALQAGGRALTSALEERARGLLERRGSEAR